MEIYSLLQHYWWFIISLLTGVLVFMLFVQGGQTLIYSIGKDQPERDRMLGALGHKWEITFTTLVTFGGAFFASFPLFYSTSFGGAFYVWMSILFLFVIQAVGYEFRKKPSNLLGERTYDFFLFLNGFLGTLLLGCAVGTLFTGGEFIVNRHNIVSIAGQNVISVWQNPLLGLEALFDYRNVALGLALFFLSRVLAIHYFFNSVNTPAIIAKSKKPLLISSVGFVVAFLTFLISILFSSGVAYDPISESFARVEFQYLINLKELPAVSALLVIGVVVVLYAVWLGLARQSEKSIWFSGAGTVLTVTMLILLAGYNNTSYYPSLSDINSSLTISNSSSSEFTLTVMSCVSLIIPIVVWYIWYAWKQMGRYNDKNNDTYM